MHINNEDQAREAVSLWRTEPIGVQLKKLKLAKESLELSQMYYEQKGNDPGTARMDASLHIIRTRMAEIEGH